MNGEYDKDNVEHIHSTASAVGDNAERNQGNDDACYRDQSKEEHHNRKPKQLRKMHNPKRDKRQNTVDERNDKLSLEHLAERSCKFASEKSNLLIKDPQFARFKFRHEFRKPFFLK